MRREAWSRVEELFHAAQAKAPEERPAFLERSCTGDAELRAEVESLLRAADDSFLEGSPLSSMEKARPGLAAGTKLGHFEIVEALGRGGMGEVYRARDLRLGREVALKTLPTVFAEDRNRLARFEHEARAASALNHPNIVGVFDVGSSDGVFWIASELVQGETLAEAIARGPIATRRLIEVASQIAAGLAAAHAMGVIHRDLKPANVMLTRDARVKILDFGLAKHNPRAEGRELFGQTQSMTLPGMAMGTPGYMSPEQVRGEAVDARSDIFSFGAILYEMASGRRAFQGDSSVAVMNAILKDDPLDLPPDVPPMVDRIARRCLEKEPARRFQSAADLQFALETIASGPLRTAVSVPSKRGKRLAAVLAFASVVAAGAYWLRGVVAPRPPVERHILRQITFDQGLTADPAISPDGKLLAFASDRAGAGNLDIWVKQIDGGEPVQLTKDPADEYDLTFSPDGARIAFRSERDGGGIYIMPALGGEASLLVSRAWRPRFSPDGQYMLYVTGVPPQRIGVSSDPNHVFVMPLSVGGPVELSKGCLVVTNTPLWAPDGAHALFPGMCNGHWDIWSADVAGKELQPTGWREYASSFNLQETWYSDVGSLGWLDHPLRLLVAARSGTANFLMAAPAGRNGKPRRGAPEKITFGTGAEMQASVAANGRVAVGGISYEAHIWGVPIDDTGRATGPARQLTSELSGEIQPVISDDGKHMVFTAAKSIPTQLYGKDLTTSHVRRLSPDSAWIKLGGTFGQGGSEVIYADISERSPALYSVPFAGGVPKRLGISRVHGTPSDWARTGKAVLLMSYPQTAPHFTVNVADVTTGQVVPLLADREHDVFEPHFSPDAHRVTFTVFANGKSRVFIAPFRWGAVPPAEWQLITNDQAWNDKPRFSNDGLSILYSSDRDGFRCIWAQRLTAEMRPEGEPQAVFHSHGSQLSIQNGPLSDQGMSVGKGWVVFDQTEFRGNIWMLEPAPTGGPPR